MARCMGCSRWQRADGRGGEEMAKLGFGVCSVAQTAEQRATFLPGRREHECAKLSPAPREVVKKRALFLGLHGEAA